MAEGWKNSGLVKVEGIPGPTGSYEVGCTHLMHQDLQMRLYYPTERDLATTFEYATYYPHPNYLTAMLDIFNVPLSGLASGVLRFLFTPRIPALLNAPLIQHKLMEPLENHCASTITQDNIKGFPVVVFSHGLLSHFHIYSGICSDLASYGYVVAAVEHRDGSAKVALRRVPGPGVQDEQYDQYVDEWIPYNEVLPITDKRLAYTNFPLRNEQVKQRAKEMGQALDILNLLNEGGDVCDMLGGQFDFTQFKGRLNMELAAVCGHSFGGCTVVQTLSEDSRFRCGIAMDTWMFPLAKDIYTHGIHQALTFINSFNFQWARNVASMMKLIKPPSETGFSNCTLYTIKGTTHLTQTDAPFTAIPWTLTEYTNPPLDKYIAHEVNMEIIHAFLKRFLVQDPNFSGRVPILDGGEDASEHILYGTNVDWEKKKNIDEMPSEPTASMEAKD